MTAEQRAAGLFIHRGARALGDCAVFATMGIWRYSKSASWFRAKISSAS
jgi:hypothetical protein